MSNVRKAKHGWVLTLIFSLISIAYIMPIVIVLMNSFKRKIFISNRPFALPDAKSFVKIENYINGIQKTDFFRAFGYTLFIYSWLCICDRTLYIYVCLVYLKGKE